MPPSVRLRGLEEEEEEKGMGGEAKESRRKVMMRGGRTKGVEWEEIPRGPPGSQTMDDHRRGDSIKAFDPHGKGTYHLSIFVATALVFQGERQERRR